MALLAVLPPGMGRADALQASVAMATHAVGAHPGGVWNLGWGAGEAAWALVWGRESGEAVFAKLHSGHMLRCALYMALSAISQKVVRHLRDTQRGEFDALRVAGNTGGVGELLDGMGDRGRGSIESPIPAAHSQGGGFFTGLDFDFGQKIEVRLEAIESRVRYAGSGQNRHVAVGSGSRNAAGM